MWYYECYAFQSSSLSFCINCLILPQNNSTFIKRDLLENPDGSLSENDLFILRLIEFANLYDQDALQNKPNLIEFYKKIEHSVKDDLKKYKF